MLTVFGGESFKVDQTAADDAVVGNQDEPPGLRSLAVCVRRHVSARAEHHVGDLVAADLRRRGCRQVPGVEDVFDRLGDAEVFARIQLHLIAVAGGQGFGTEPHDAAA